MSMASNLSVRTTVVDIVLRNKQELRFKYGLKFTREGSILNNMSSFRFIRVQVNVHQMQNLHKKHKTYCCLKNFCVRKYLITATVMRLLFIRTNKSILTELRVEPLL